MRKAWAACRAARTKALRQRTETRTEAQGARRTMKREPMRARSRRVRRRWVRTSQGRVRKAAARNRARGARFTGEREGRAVATVARLVMAAWRTMSVMSGEGGGRGLLTRNTRRARRRGTA